MELGMIGLGRMGGNMAERIGRAGHRVVGYNRSADAIDRLVKKRGVGAQSIEELVKKLSPPRAAWMMVPPPAARGRDGAPRGGAGRGNDPRAPAAPREGRHPRGRRELVLQRLHPARILGPRARAPGPGLP